MTPMLRSTALVSSLVLSVCGCRGTLDAGRDLPSDGLPSVGSNPLDAGGPAVMTPVPDVGPPQPTPLVEAGTPASPEPPAPVIEAGPALPEEPAPVVEAGIPAMPEEPAPVVDAGGDAVESLLPVDADNPILLVNDLFRDNWSGEYALLAASTDRINLVGIVVNTSEYSPDLEFNLTGWQQLIDAARASGLRNVPDLVAGASAPLAVPADENIDATQPNNSLGAQFIVDAANRLGTPELPLVVINGSTLTDVADAYLLDPSVSERLVVVAALGWAADDGSAVVGGPNGELDTWAGNIVAQRLNFVQVSAFYEQAEDVPEDRVGQLPANPFGDWIAGKRSEITNAYAADQIALLAVAFPGFAVEARRVGYAGRNPQGEALLAFRDDGCCWFVAQGDGNTAANVLWEMLDDPNSFGP